MVRDRVGEVGRDQFREEPPHHCWDLEPHPDIPNTPISLDREWLPSGTGSFRTAALPLSLHMWI